MKKTLAFTLACAAALSVSLASCGEVDSSVAETPTSEASTSASSSATEQEDSSVTEQAEGIQVSTSIGNPYKEDPEWVIENESVEKKIYDWYDNFKTAAPQEVNVDNNEPLNGGKQVYISFKDENGETVKISSSNMTGANVVVNGKYYLADGSVLTLAADTQPEGLDA